MRDDDNLLEQYEDDDTEYQKILDAQHDNEEEEQRALERVENQKRAVLETAIDVAREHRSRDFNVGFELIKGVIASGISAGDGYRDNDPYSAAENVLGDAYVIAVAELQNSESTVRLMLENGASVRASGSSGTLLHHATTPEFIDHLIEKGFNDLHDESEFGQTAMDTAIKNDRLAVAEKLVEIGLTVDSDRRLFAAQLHHAESAEMAQFMIDNGVNVNQQDSYGQTALHKLARSLDSFDSRGEAQVAACLLRNGADPHIQDQTGKTMIDVAAKNGQRERMQMIVKENERNVPSISNQREHGRDHSPSFSR